jgi:hypothetical protein
MDNVECVIVDPQDGGNWFARSGTDSVSELASKVGNLLVDGKHIRVFVFLIPDAVSRVEEYVCVQIQDKTFECFYACLTCSRCDYLFSE